MYPVDGRGGCIFIILTASPGGPSFPAGPSGPVKPCKQSFFSHFFTDFRQFQKLGIFTGCLRPLQEVPAGLVFLLIPVIQLSLWDPINQENDSHCLCVAGVFPGLQSDETYWFPRQSSRSWFSLLDRELNFRTLTEKCTKS